MDVKEAVSLAKHYVLDLFQEEQIQNLGLEEVEFEDVSNTWTVTIGFSRPWDRPSNPLATLAEQFAPPNRSYKVVTIDDRTAKVRSVKNRETRSWAESA